MVYVYIPLYLWVGPGTFPSNPPSPGASWPVFTHHHRLSSVVCRLSSVTYDPCALCPLFKQFGNVPGYEVGTDLTRQPPVKVYLVLEEGNWRVKWASIGYDPLQIMNNESQKAVDVSLAAS